MAQPLMAQPVDRTEQVRPQQAAALAFLVNGQERLAFALIFGELVIGGGVVEVVIDVAQLLFPPACLVGGMKFQSAKRFRYGSARHVNPFWGSLHGLGSPWP